MKKLNLILGIALLLFTSCKDTPVLESTENPNAAILLNEGNWNLNDASLSSLDLDGNITNGLFAARNHRGLGDVAQDLQRYGNKIYTVVTYSNTVEVTDLNLNSIKQISLPNRLPRYIAFHDGKAYVSCYDHNILRLDTATLEVEAVCPVTGLNPEGLAIQNGHIFVAHGWEYSDQGAYGTIYDSTLSVIDLATFTETGHITLGINPSKIISVDENTIAILTLGDYGASQPSLWLLNTRTLQPTNTHQPAAGICVSDGILYGYQATYDFQTYSNIVSFFTLNPATPATPEPLTISHTFTDPYCIAVNPQNGQILIANSPYGSLGDLYCFTPQGEPLWNVETGYYPSRILFL